MCPFCGTHNTLSNEVWAQVRPPTPSPTPHVAQEVPSKSPVGLIIGLSMGAAVIITGAVALSILLSVPTQVTTTPAPSAFAAPNSPCNGTKAACSLDKKSMLECENDKLVVSLTCKGPNGCRALEHGTSVSCDYTRADVNDPCNNNDSSCSTDGKSQLRCDGVKWVMAQACGGPDGCSIAPNKEGSYTLTCDDHVAPVDAPCLEDGRFACSADMKSLLRCTRGHFVVASACKKPCSLKKDKVADTTEVICER